MNHHGRMSEAIAVIQMLHEMKKHLQLALLILVISACSSSSNSSKSGTNETESDATLPAISAEAVTEAIRSNDVNTAFTMLKSNDFTNRLALKEYLFFWYEGEPHFSSWLVSDKSIREGPSYFFLDQLMLKDLTDALPGEELLIYAGHIPYTFIDAYAAVESVDGSGYELVKILQTEFNGTRADAVITAEPAPDEPDLGVTDEFEIKRDQYKILSFSKPADYASYISWIEDQLTKASESGEKADRVPDRFSSLLPVKGVIPIGYSGLDDGSSLLLFEDENAYGDPVYRYAYAVYREDSLRGSGVFLDDEDHICPFPQVSVDNNLIKVFKPGCEGDHGEPGTEFSYADSTYYYSVAKDGTLKPWTDALKVEGNRMSRLSYDIQLAGFGKVQFVTSMSSDGGSTRIFSYLISDQEVVYQFPEHEANQWMPEEASDHEWKAVFQDLNEDGKQDLIFMASATTDVGADGARVFPVNNVYLRSGDQFDLQENLSDTISKMTSAEMIKTFFKSQ